MTTQTKSDKELKRTIREAEKTIATIDALTPVEAVTRGVDDVLARYEQALERKTLAEAELDSRRKSSLHANLIERLPGLRQQEREKKAPHPAMPALRRVQRFGHVELEGTKLVTNLLTRDEGIELAGLVKRKLAHALGRDGAEPVAADEVRQYEQLVGKAAGDESLFERRRAERAAQAKLNELKKARQRHPQAESIIAAVLADPSLWDLLHERLREARITDEHGAERDGWTNERIFDLEHISTLYMLLWRIVENGGKPVALGQHGLLDRELPLVEMKTLAQLRRNGFITVSRDGAGYRIGLGERSRHIAARWGLDVPQLTGA